MTTGAQAARWIVGLFGLGLIVAGAFLSASLGPVVGIWLIAGGTVLLIGVIVERSRYRSQEAERSKLEPGPGGGETGPLPARFHGTDEVFVDPTTSQKMRVYVDSNTGERRYVAEA